MEISQYCWDAATGWDKVPTGSQAKVNLIFVFGTTAAILKSNCLAELQNSFTGALMIGCSATGEIIGTTVSDDRLIATTVAFERSRVIGTCVYVPEHSSSVEATKSLLSQIPREDLRHVFVLVEDWELNGVLLGQILYDLGLQDITIVANGKEAVEAVNIAEKPFSLILMDIQMPVMGGIDATRAIRRIDPEVPILALTAHAMKEDAHQCRTAGMNAYLSKPYSIDEITEALKQVLQ